MSTEIRSQLIAAKVKNQRLIKNLEFVNELQKQLDTQLPLILFKIHNINSCTIS